MWQRVLAKKVIYMHDVQRLLVAAKVCLQYDWIDVPVLRKLLLSRFLFCL